MGHRGPLGRSGCVRKPSETAKVFQVRAAGELQQLPSGAAIEQIIADYQVMRDQARACTRIR